MFAKNYTENEDQTARRSTTPQSRPKISEGISNLVDPSHDTPSRSSYAAEKYHQRSTIFDATLELSALEEGLVTPRYVRTNLNRTPTRLRETRTYSSTVFLAPDNGPSTVSPYKPKDHSTHDLFGDQGTEWFCKKMTIPGYVPNFQPRYKEINPKSSKNQDMYGDVSEFCQNKSELEMLTPSNMTAKDNHIRKPSNDKEISSTLRKSLDLKSRIFQRSESAETIKHQLEEVSCERSTERIIRKDSILRKSVDLSQNKKSIEHCEDFLRLGKSVDVLRESNYSSPKVRLIKKAKCAEVAIQVNPLQSARYRRQKENLDSPREQIKLIPRSRSQTPNKNNFPILNINPKVLKQRELNLTSIEYIRDESRTEDFELIGLRTQDNESSIKDLLKGVHVVNITPRINNITGECMGSATLSLRYQPQYKSIEKLKSNCSEKGLTLSASIKDLGKKNNYAELSNRKFLDTFLKADEKKIVDKYATPRTMRPDLVSSDDVMFGSSPGVGRLSYITPKAPDRIRASIDS